MRTAVVMTVCDRPDYLRQTLARWANVAGVDEPDWYFMLEPTEQQARCWQLVHDFVGAALPGEGFVIWPNERRLGVLENPYRGLQLAFDTGYDYVILAEDDVLVSRDVLAYHAWAAERCRSLADVLAVCSHTIDGGPGGEYDAGFLAKFDPLVWGTWAEKWRRVIDPTWDHDYSSGPGGRVQAGWDWELNRQLQQRGMTTVTPYRSRSMHIGQHGGTHCTPEMYPATASRCFTAEREPGDYCLIDALIGD